jgi:heat shock protein HtpX
MYRAQPLPPAAAPDVLRVFDTLAARGELDPPPRLYYVPSQMPNAFAVGLGRDAAVAVTDGLLRMLSLRELAGVLAHEISHIRHRDTRVMALADVFSRMTTSLSQVGQVLLFLSLPAVLMGSSPLPLGGVVALVLAPSASVLMQLALSRSREFDADLGAIELTGDPDGLASALLKLERWQEGPWWKRIWLPTPTTREPAMLRTHPHTAARVERLQNLHPEAGDGVAARLAIPSSLTSVALSPVPRRPRWHLTGTWY